MMTHEASRFEVFESIGKGGMAVVHRAVQHGARDFRRTVALKRMLPHLSSQPSMVRRFIAEAKVASQLNHPNIAQVYDFGRTGDEYFIAMELVDGCSLRQLIRKTQRAGGTIPLRVIVGILRQLACALDHVHQQVDGDGLPIGLAHRDISPSNIMITRDGHVKLIDFGVAATSTDNSKGAVGKIAYMAPEEIQAAAIDPRSDVWAFGVIAWELVTAARLFVGASDHETVQRVLTARIPSPSEIEARCPLELDLIILAALTRHPNARTQSAAEIIGEIDDFAMSARLNVNASVLARWIQRGEQAAPALIGAGTPPPPAPRHDAQTIAVAMELVVKSLPAAPPSVSWSSLEVAAIGHRITRPRGSQWRRLGIAIAVLALVIGVVRGFGVSSSTAAVAGGSNPRTDRSSTDRLSDANHQQGLEHSLVATDEARDSADSAASNDDARSAKQTKLIKRRAQRDEKKQRSRSKQSRSSEGQAEPHQRKRPSESRRQRANVFAHGLSVVPAPPAPPAHRKKRRIVRPTAVKRLSGKIPSLRLRSGSLSQAESRFVSARFCIDEVGKVTSVSVTGSPLKTANRQIARGLRAWRFSPYIDSGNAIPVCFAKQFQVKAR